jgi:hypothetical protein
MAYVLPTEDEDEKARQEAAGSAGPAASAAPAISGGGAPAHPMGGAGASGRPAKPSTNFVSFDRVLAANKDAATGLAASMAKPIEAAGQQSKQSVAGASNAFANKVQAGLPAGMQSTPFQGKPAATPQPTGKPAAPFASLSAQQVPNFTSPTQSKPASPTNTSVQSQGTVSGTTLTPEQAKAQAEWKYAGPNSMDEDAGWGDILSKAGEAQRDVALTGNRNEAGELQGNAGLQAMLQQQAGGSYTQGQSKMDAGLIGSAGRPKWDSLNEEYGDLVGGAKAANEASKGVAEAARGNVATQAEGAKAALAKWDADAKQAEADAEARRLRAEQETAAAANKKKDLMLGQGEGKAQDWKTYNTTNTFENTLADIGEALDPVNWFVKAGGGASHHGKLREAMDDQINKAGGEVNSNKINWGWSGQFAGVPENVKAGVYDSLTAAELHALERMSDGDMRKFVNERIGVLGKEAAQTLAAPEFAGMSDPEIFGALTIKYGIDPFKATNLFEMRKAAKRMGII